MSVGIMDADIAKYILVPFNLEAMKLASYYKKNKEIVVLATDFCPERNTKFFYRKDYYDGDFPIDLTCHKNVEYGGLAFSGNKYNPLPLEIEVMRPDASIYSKMEKPIKQTTNAARQKIYQNMMTAEHCRLSLDGSTIWEDYPKQFKFLAAARNLMLHDYDLGKIKGSFEEVQKILSRARTDGWATKVGMKFPVQISTGQELLNWASLNANSIFYSVKYNGVIDNDAFLEWIRYNRERQVFTQMEYCITDGRYDPNEFVKNLLPQIFRQVIISRSYYVFFTLKYDEGFFPDPMWEKVIKLFNFYHNSFASVGKAAFLNKIAGDTMFDFAKACDKVPRGYYGDQFIKEDVREIFSFVRENNYPLFKDFYECNARSLGGKI